MDTGDMTPREMPRHMPPKPEFYNKLSATAEFEKETLALSAEVLPIVLLEGQDVEATLTITPPAWDSIPYEYGDPRAWKPFPRVFIQMMLGDQCIASNEAYVERIQEEEEEEDVTVASVVTEDPPPLPQRRPPTSGRPPPPPLPPGVAAKPEEKDTPQLPPRPPPRPAPPPVLPPRETTTTTTTPTEKTSPVPSHGAPSPLQRQLSRKSSEGSFNPNADPEADLLPAEAVKMPPSKERDARVDQPEVIRYKIQCHLETTVEDDFDMPANVVLFFEVLRLRNWKAVLEELATLPLELEVRRLDALYEETRRNPMGPQGNWPRMILPARLERPMLAGPSKMVGSRIEFTFKNVHKTQDLSFCDVECYLHHDHTDRIKGLTFKWDRYWPPPLRLKPGDSLMYGVKLDATLKKKVKVVDKEYEKKQNLIADKLKEKKKEDVDDDLDYPVEPLHLILEFCFHWHKPDGERMRIVHVRRIVEWKPPRKRNDVLRHPVTIINMDDPDNPEIPEEWYLPGQDPELVEIQEEGKLIEELFNGGRRDWDAHFTPEENAAFAKEDAKPIPGLGGGKSEAPGFPDLAQFYPKKDDVSKNLADDIEGLVDVLDDDDADDKKAAEEEKMKADIEEKKKERSARRKKLADKKKSTT